MSAESSQPDESAVLERAEGVSRLLSIHAGGITIDEIREDGGVEVGFTGMCTGCPFRAVTLATTIRPALIEVEGVTQVTARGVNISEHAAKRLAAVSAAWWKSRELDDTQRRHIPVRAS